MHRTPAILGIEIVISAVRGRVPEAEFVRRAPFYEDGADVILGGWHMMWPDDDFFLPREMRLLATTIREAEPFVEIWLSELGNVSVKSRIT